MNETEGVAELYAAYLKKAETLERERKPGQGLFGFGQTPADDPCHEAFIRGLKELLDVFLSAGAAQNNLAECLAFIFHAPLEHRQPPSVYWTLLAAHSAAVEAAAALSQEDAQRLYEQYDKEYPRRYRLPVQKQLMKALDRARRG